MLVALVVLLALAFLGYAAWAPYSLPDRRFVEPDRDFVPVAPTRTGDRRRVVLLVFDGLSPAAVRAADTPHLDRMAREGASTLGMRPEFPTLSMPNHFSLGTGCTPARHGIVSNLFIDPERGVFDAKGDADWVVDCELLHEVAEAQGVRSAIFGNVGNSSTQRGRLATIAEPFHPPPPPASAQIDRVLEVLRERRDIGLIGAYVTEPDESGHRFGPTAPETLRATSEVDFQIGRVIDAIEALGLRDSVTLVVTTDHGMVGAKPVMLNYEGIIRRAGVEARVVGAGAIAHIYLDDPFTRETARRALEGDAHYDVIDPSDPPDDVRIGASARTGDLLFVADPGYWGADLAHVPWYLRWLVLFGGDTLEVERARGMHGYRVDAAPGVRAVFFAWGGGSVPPGTALDDMRTIDVHPTIAALLGSSPGQPIDGRAHPALLGDAHP